MCIAWSQLNKLHFLTWLNLVRFIVICGCNQANYWNCKNVECSFWILHVSPHWVRSGNMESSKTYKKGARDKFTPKALLFIDDASFEHCRFSLICPNSFLFLLWHLTRLYSLISFDVLNSLLIKVLLFGLSTTRWWSLLEGFHSCGRITWICWLIDREVVFIHDWYIYCFEMFSGLWK